MDRSGEIRIDKNKKLAVQEFVRTILDISNLPHKNLKTGEKDLLIADIVENAYAGRTLTKIGNNNLVNKSLINFDKALYSSPYQILEVQEIVSKWEIEQKEFERIVCEFCEKYSLNILLLYEAIRQINNFSTLDLCE